MSLAQFAADLQKKQAEKRKAAHAAPWVPTATPASSIGYQCERRIVMQRTNPNDAAPPSEELSSIFDEGNLHHKDVRRELSELGFEVVDGETQFFDERLDLRGHIDGRILVPTDIFDASGTRTGVKNVRVPVEIKSTTGDGPKTLEQWKAAHGLFGRYYDQLQIYLFLTNSPEGLGLFKDKITGLWDVVAAPLDFEHAEKLIQKAERVRDAVRLKVLPERLADRSECKGCPFFATCLPGDAPVDPLLLAEDEDLLRDLAERDSLREPADRWEKLDKRLKERFKLTNGARFVAGDFEITKKVNARGAVTVTMSRMEGGAA